MDVFDQNTGKYFFIKCKLHDDLVLDVKGAKANPNTEVILFRKKTPVADNQLWYYNAAKRAIFTKVGNLCIDVDDQGHIVINPPTGSDAQQWMFKGDNIVRVSNPKKAIDVKQAKFEKKNHLVEFTLHNKDNQQFVLEFQPPKLFYIKSVARDQVLDVEGSSKSPGAKGCLLPKKGREEADSQLFYEDHLGCIRSHLTHFVLECHDAEVTFNSYAPGNPRQRWCVHDNHIVSADRPNEALTANNRGLKVKDYREGDRKQQWQLDYV